MIIDKSPIVFHCNDCDTDWEVPPNSCCPNCGYGANATPDPRVWEVGNIRIDDPSAAPWSLNLIYISAHLRDRQRTIELIRDYRIKEFIDVAGDVGYVYRPQPYELKMFKASCTMVANCYDNGDSLPAEAFEEVKDAIDGALSVGNRVLLHCAAGLRRAPHLLYGYFRYVGLDPIESWDLVEAARPYAYMHTPYIESAEDWLATRD